MRRVSAFVRLSRLYFLPLPMLTYAIGVAWAERTHSPLDGRRLALGLLIELLVQLSAAYLNDYWDIPTDRLNTNRTLLTGGSGELTTGVLPPAVAPVAAALCQGAALLIAVRADLSRASWLVLAASAAVAIFYTTPPVRLAWRGLGELATATVAALLVPQWAYSLQMGHVSERLLTITLPLVPMLMALFVAIALPDVAADGQVGKRTIPVRLGPPRARVLYAGLLAAGYLGCFTLWNDLVPIETILLALTGILFGVAAWRAQAPPLTGARLRLLLMVLISGMPALIAVVALNLGLRAS